MLPANVASTYPVPAGWLPPDDQVVSPLVDHEMGGIAINDASRGLLYQEWLGWVEGINFRLKPAAGDPITVYSAGGVTEMSFCFDQNMRPAFGYTLAGVCYLRWFDNTVNAYRVITMGAGRNPRMTLDDKRPTQVGNSDMIFAFIDADNRLCYFRQRDRFLTRFVLQQNVAPALKLKNVGMSKAWRLQFEIVT